MAMTAESVYAILKNYVKESLLGGGAVVGKNVTIQSILPIMDGNKEIGNKVTFSYTLDDGETRTSSMDVMNGKDGSIGGNNDYDDLDNKPQINDVVLQGNKSFDDLGLSKENLDIDFSQYFSWWR